MKRITFLFGLLVLLSTVSASATVLTGCMDCTVRKGQFPDGSPQLIAECCMSFQGHCYAGDSIIDLNAGWGCLIASDGQGNTMCASSKSDTWCQGGGNKQKFAEFQNDSNGCQTDQYGWCDTSCSSCTA